MGVLDNILRVHMVADAKSASPLLHYSWALISEALASIGDIEAHHKLGITIQGFITITYQQSQTPEAQLANETGLKDKHTLRNCTASFPSQSYHHQFFSFWVLLFNDSPKLWSSLPQGRMATCRLHCIYNRNCTDCWTWFLTEFFADAYEAIKDCVPITTILRQVRPNTCNSIWSLSAPFGLEDSSSSRTGYPTMINESHSSCISVLWVSVLQIIIPLYSQIFSLSQ